MSDFAKREEGRSLYGESIGATLGIVRGGRYGRLGEAVERGLTKTPNLLRWALQL